MTIHNDFRQISWDESLAADWRELLRLAVREDLGREHDWTTLSLIPAESTGRFAIAARQPGVIAGLRCAQLTAAEYDRRIDWKAEVDDGAMVAAGDVVAHVAGPTRAVLTAERVMLNVLGRLSGVATTTRGFVDAVAKTKAVIYDTRKTTPGWRRLEKYAVRLGGASNHRTGLYDAMLIKDNHLVLGSNRSSKAAKLPSAAVKRARKFAAEQMPAAHRTVLPLEVEVETLEQLRDALAAEPDLVLLDNMTPETLRKAVSLRNQEAPEVLLEASGGITLDNVAQVAKTGVDRISVGALTHAAAGLDLGLDFEAAGV